MWTTPSARVGWPVCFTILANAAGRFAFAAREHQLGRDRVATLAGGLLADVAWLAPLFALALWTAEKIADRVAADPRRRRLGSIFTVGTAIAVAAVMWLVSVGATEFRMQRGAYPTFGEAWEALGDPTFVRGSLGILLFERYSTTTVVSAALLAVGAFVYETTRAASTPPSLVAASLFVAAPAGSLALLLRVVVPGARFERPVPPMVRLAFGALAPSRLKGASGARALLEATTFGDDDVRAGLRLYGFDPAAGSLTSSAPPECSRHPLARSLDPPADAPELVRAFVDVSAALFNEAPAEPLTIWQVALESFRADDVHALHRAAPADLTPFIDRIYEEARYGTRPAIAFPHAYQGGIRTAHALSALTCGLGALPFQLALSRDLFDLPLRCAPDVLRDAGFATRLDYGSDSAFEHMQEFARARGMEIVDATKLPPDLPRGAWRAATDGALFAQATHLARPGPALQYHFVLTLSGHTPFDRPDDITTDVAARAANAARGAVVPTRAEDVRRLATMAYTDDALGKWIGDVEVSSDRARSIFVVSADHATSDPFLWDTAMPSAAASVPFFVEVGPALVAASPHPDEVAQKLRAAAAIAERTPVSLNDVPALILALVHHHPALRRLSPELRWQTLGGSAGTSATFAAPLGGAVVWGIDAQSRVFVVPSAAPASPVLSDEPSVPFSVWNEPLGPVLRGSAAALAAFLGGYAQACPADAGRQQAR